MVRFARQMSWLPLSPTRLLAWGLLAVLLGISTAPAPAHASAGGYQYWGGFHVTVEGQSLRIPAGQLYHYISGSGYKISWEALT